MANHIVPIFPLPASIFPGETFPVHVFEDRFRKLIAFCRSDASNGEFGINYKREDAIAGVGCMVRIKSILQEQADGNVDLLVEGLCRYRILEELHDGDYPRARIERIEEPREAVNPELRNIAITLHIKLHELVSGSPPYHQFNEDDPISFTLAHQAGLDQDQRQDVLERKDENDRLRLLVAYYRVVIPRVQDKQEVRSRVLLNGHFVEGLLRGRSAE